MDLQCRIGDACEHFCRVKLGARDFSVRWQTLIQTPCTRKGKPIRGINFGNHIGNLKTDTLEFADLLAELFSLCGVVQSIVKTAACTSDAKCRHSQTSGIKPFVHHRKTAIDLAQDLRIGEAAIRKIEYIIFVATMGN